MQVQVELKDWKFERSEDGIARINGSFEVKAGATVIAKQTFNAGYGSIAIPFSTQLMLDIENLTERVRKEIQQNFTGKEE